MPALATFLLLVTRLGAQVPHPADVYGFTPGDDYKLATYDQMLEYYERLDAASDRVQMQEIGKSVLGRPLLLLLISSEENMRQLEKWRNMSEQLARGRIDEETAHRFAKEGNPLPGLMAGCMQLKWPMRK